MANGNHDLLEELLAPVGGVTIRRMFGGLGIFRDGVMFGLVAQDVLYFRADDASKAAYEAEGSGPWSVHEHGRPMTMPYWRAPDRLFDEPEAFLDWALEAHAAALRAKTAKPVKKPRPSRRNATKLPVPNAKPT